MSRIRRKGKVVPGHPRLSVVQQCKLLGLSRSSVYYRPVGESKRNLDLMRQIDEQFLVPRASAWDSYACTRPEIDQSFSG